MDLVRKAGHKIQKFVAGNRQDHDSAASSNNQQQENLDLSDLAKILVLGETGSGKSTFINYLTNYFRNGSLQNIKIAIPSKFHPRPTEQFAHSERDIQNNTLSKTDDCNQYMFSTESKQYLFIDTPGLSDTRGTEQDDKNIMKIVESGENLGGLTAVIIVVNGAVARLTVNLQNVLVRLRGNLPDIVMDNIIIVLTNSTRHGANFTIEALGMNGNIYPYYMQNSAFSQDPNTWTASAKGCLQDDWEQSMSEIKNMVETIDTFKSKSVTAFKEMKDIRNKIKSLLHAARLEVNQIQKMQDEISAFETALSQADDDLVNYNDYATERVVDKVEIVDAPYHSTLCQNCNHVCHDNCGLDETIIAGAQIFQRCWAITDGFCTQCKHKCSYTAHYHAKKKVEITKETLQDVLADIKAKYDQAATNKNEYQDKITSVEDAKKLLENALKQKSDDIEELCITLHKICSGFNLVQELSILIDQLQKEANMLKNIDAKQQADEFIRSLKELCHTIAEDQKNAKPHLPQMKIINTERPVVGQVKRIFTSSPNNNSSVAPKDISEPADSGSHANRDVLATLQTIAKKKQAKSEELEQNNKTDDKKIPKKNEPCEDISEEELKQLPITELLIRYHKYKNDRRKENFIIYELEQRSMGKSQPDIINACIRNAQKYCTYSLDALRTEYDQLTKIVSSYTRPDILKIDQVPLDTLIGVSVIYKFLENPPAGLNNQPPNINPNGQQANMPPHWTPFNPPPPSTHPSMYAPMNPNIIPPFNPGPSQNYPTFSGPYPYDPKVIYPQPTQQFFHQDASHSQQQGFQPIIRSNTASPSNMNSAFRDMRLEPKSHDTCDSTRQSPREPFSTNTSDVRSDNINKLITMTNAELISAYKDAFNRGQYAQSQKYYTELEQRCYGKHPTLIQSNSVLFSKTYSMYQDMSLEKLNHTKLQVHENIKKSLNDNDATRIEELPPELIIQAAVLDHLIEAKSSESHQ
jgi:ElaB/YqjD/DUF883 family membrane-anchored ribosome-binding protein